MIHIEVVTICRRCCIVDEFLEKFLNTSLLNHTYPDKYNHILQNIRQDHYDETNTILRKIFNDENMNIEACQKTPGIKLLFKALFSKLLIIQYFFKCYDCYTAHSENVSANVPQ